MALTRIEWCVVARTGNEAVIEHFGTTEEAMDYASKFGPRQPVPAQLPPPYKQHTIEAMFGEAIEEGRPRSEAAVFWRVVDTINDAFVKAIAS
jgi:hypothetical protein